MFEKLQIRLLEDDDIVTFAKEAHRQLRDEKRTEETLDPPWLKYISDELCRRFGSTAWTTMYHSEYLKARGHK